MNSFEHGFRKSLTGKFDYSNLATQNADLYQSILIMVSDMSKAFVRISHSRLLAKIMTYGIRNPPLPHLSSYVLTVFRWSFLTVMVCSPALLPVRLFMAPLVIHFYSCKTLLISLKLFVRAHRSSLPMTAK